MLFRKPYLYIFLLLFFSGGLPAQEVLTLQRAVALGVENYGTVKAKKQYADASHTLVKQARLDYFPNINVGAQQDFGTVNGQNGPLYGFGGLGVASSGGALAGQNWNASFGALYLVNVNWDFFAFGRAKERIHTADAAASRDEKDWEQEIFKHQIRVAAAYLNLVAAKQLTLSYQKNLLRADTFRRIIIVRALNGLVAGVDSSQANAEYAGANISLIRAIDFEQEQANQLSQLTGLPPGDFKLDPLFVSRIPVTTEETEPAPFHPLLQWYKSRVTASDEQARYFRTLAFPAFTFVSVLQTRGSGFPNGYIVDQSDYTTSYGTGITPNRANYLFGIGVNWNLMQPFRVAQQVKAQRLVSQGLQYEYELADQQVRDQLQLSESKIRNATANFRESLIQVKAASDAYIQKSVLYTNGLTTLVDLTAARYVLVRAETDRDIAYGNVWQALLLKTAAVGDYSILEKQL